MAEKSVIKMYNDLVDDFETLHKELLESAISNASLLEYTEEVSIPLINKINSGDTGINPELAKEIIKKHTDLVQLVSNSSKQLAKALDASNKMRENAENRLKKIYPPDHPLE